MSVRRLNIRRLPGLPLAWRSGATPAYDPDAEAFWARFTTPPTDARKQLLSDLFVRLKTTVAFTKLDYLRIMAAETAQAAQQNLIANQFNAVPVGGPTFTADRGYNGDGSSSYVNENYNPGDGGTYRYKQDDAYFAAWFLTNIATTASRAGTMTSNTVSLVATASAPTGRINRPGNVTGAAMPTGVGLLGVARSGANERLSKDGVSIGTTTGTSSAVANSVLALGRSNTTTYRNDQFAVSMAGAYLTEAEELAIYNAILLYLQAVGAAI